MGALEHTVTWEQVRDRAGLRPTPTAPDVEAEATRLLGLALADLGEALEGAFRPMPTATADECLLTIAKAYADRRRTPGNAQTTNADDAQLRQVPRDPLAGIRPILARYTVGLA